MMRKFSRCIPVRCTLFFLRCLKNGFLKNPLPACIRYNRSVHSGHMYGSRLSFLFDAATAEISTTLPSSAGSRTYALSIRNSPRFCRFFPAYAGIAVANANHFGTPACAGKLFCTCRFGFRFNPVNAGTICVLIAY